MSRCAAGEEKERKAKADVNGQHEEQIEIEGRRGTRMGCLRATDRERLPVVNVGHFNARQPSLYGHGQ